MKTIQFICLLGPLLVGACSSIERGVVVAKGHRVKPGASPPIDYYWVDVRGPNRKGEQATARLQLFKPDWDRFNEGDAISPREFGPIGVARKLGKSLQESAQGASPSSPEPAREPDTPIREADPATAHRESPTGTRFDMAKEPRPLSAPQPETDRAARFRNAEARALDDPAVRELKLKIHNAKTDDEQAAAWQEYRRALFQKMRDLEPSLKDRIDQAENAPGQR